MNQTLLENIYNQLTEAVSGTTQHVYFLHLPSDDLLQEFTVVYELNNTENENTFDSPEAEKVYSLQVKLNAPTVNLFLQHSIYIKNAVLRLKAINANIGNVSLTTDTTFYDGEFKVFTNFLNFEIKYH